MNYIIENKQKNNININDMIILMKKKQFTEKQIKNKISNIRNINTKNIKKENISDDDKIAYEL